MKEQIEKAILETLVIENKTSINIAVEKIEYLINKFAKESIQDVIKNHYEIQNNALRTGGKMQTIDYTALDYIKKHFPSPLPKQK